MALSIRRLDGGDGVVVDEAGHHSDDGVGDELGWSAEEEVAVLTFVLVISRGGV